LSIFFVAQNARIKTTQTVKPEFHHLKTSRVMCYRSYLVHIPLRRLGSTR